ncbi:MAG TPA: hypothetical protein VFC19_51970 [Candidatus Limnocylindrales bacterium]|nr:hypothetical protein [Candidatus Limnocylindrales bacterium]
MHIAIAPFRLKDGITQDNLLAASDAFEEQFVQKQDGILRRILVSDEKGGYADVVFFEDLAAIERVLQAEQDSDVCAEFFAIMDSDGSHQVYHVLKTYR